MKPALWQELGMSSFIHLPILILKIVTQIGEDIKKLQYPYFRLFSISYKIPIHFDLTFYQARWLLLDTERYEIGSLSGCRLCFVSQTEENRKM